MTKDQLHMWHIKQSEIVKDMECVLCGKPARTLHHSTSYKQYNNFLDYYNEECLTPLCRPCHLEKIHGWDTAEPADLRFRLLKIVKACEGFKKKKDNNIEELIEEIINIAQGEKKYCYKCEEEISHGVHDFTVEHFNKPLCRVCQKLEKPEKTPNYVKKIIAKRKYEKDHPTDKH